MWKTLVQGKENESWSLKEPGLNPTFSMLYVVSESQFLHL